MNMTAHEYHGDKHPASRIAELDAALTKAYHKIGELEQALQDMTCRAESAEREIDKLALDLGLIRG